MVTLIPISCKLLLISFNLLLNTFGALGHNLLEVSIFSFSATSFSLLSNSVGVPSHVFNSPVNLFIANPTGFDNIAS